MKGIASEQLTAAITRPITRLMRDVERVLGMTVEAPEEPQAGEHTARGEQHSEEAPALPTMMGSSVRAAIPSTPVATSPHEPAPESTPPVRRRVRPVARRGTPSTEAHAPEAPATTAPPSYLTEMSTRVSQHERAPLSAPLSPFQPPVSEHPPFVEGTASSTVWPDVTLPGSTPVAVRQAELAPGSHFMPAEPPPVASIPALFSGHPRAARHAPTVIPPGPASMPLSPPGSPAWTGAPATMSGTAEAFAQPAGAVPVRQPVISPPPSLPRAELAPESPASPAPVRKPLRLSLRPAPTAPASIAPRAHEDGGAPSTSGLMPEALPPAVSAPAPVSAQPLAARQAPALIPPGPAAMRPSPLGPPAWTGAPTAQALPPTAMRGTAEAFAQPAEAVPARQPIVSPPPSLPRAELATASPPAPASPRGPLRLALRRAPTAPASIAPLAHEDAGAPSASGFMPEALLPAASAPAPFSAQPLAARQAPALLPPGPAAMPLSPAGSPVWPQAFTTPHAPDTLVPPHEPPARAEALMDRERFTDTLVDILRAAARRDGVEV